MSDTTLDALQKALVPKVGMKRIPIPLESYSHTSIALSAKRLVNMMAEKQPDDARTAAALLPTPGLVQYQQIGTGPILALNTEMPGFIYLVSGTQFFRIRVEIAGTVIDFLGDVGTPAAFPNMSPPDVMVTLAVGPTAAVVCVPPNAFTCGHTGIAHQLGGTFPGNAATVSYLDGYFGFTSTLDRQQFFICGLLDPDDFDALDFATADAMPNTLNRILGHRGEFWLIGHSGMEVWYDSGDADFPFRRRPGSVIPHGCGSPRTIATADGSVFWSGLSATVFRSKGYLAERISTHAIEQAYRLSGGAPAVVSSFAYTQGGHTVYVMNLPDRSFVYDCATGVWHERTSGADGAGRWRASVAGVGSDLPLLGDSLTGKVFFSTPDVTTEDGAVMLRQVTLPPLWAGTARAFCSRLEIEMEVGTGYAYAGTVLLEWSDDGGITWTGSHTMRMADYTEYRRRMVVTRLGSFRQRVFRVSRSGFLNVYAIDAQITAGAH